MFKLSKMKFHSLSYSNKKLESLSKENLKERGIAPWFQWVSEIYSLGKTFRIKYNIPKIISLPFSSDHGVNIQTTYDEYERSTKGPYFTWNKKKLSKIKATGREAYLIQHPWINYKKKINFKLSNKRKGTLVFFPKSIESLRVNEKFIDQYVKKLKKLPKKCKPLTICLFYYDINQGLHKKLRKYKIPIVTAGYSSSIFFVDRFYNLIKNFKYATSALGGRPGSYFYFCIDASLPFFFYGSNLEYYSHGNGKFKKGKIPLHKIPSEKYGAKKEYLEIKNVVKNFNIIRDEVTTEQKKTIRKYLGFESNIFNKKVSFIIWKSLVTNFYFLIKIYYYGIFHKYIKKILNINY